ncbi:hypothetical protein ABT173_09965 [Streptomyces sp. NPDC001795]|uniref:hypothetical protein n=1 Tax=unclassified Streptomyces TaxID=2593676 RepID=UPI00332BBC98
MADPETSGPEIGVTYERLLDQALSSWQVREALDRAAGVLDREQLRTRALQARTAVVATAAIEYRDYLQARAVAAERGGRRQSAAAARGAGGILPVPPMFVPSLSAVAAGVFLLSGYALRAVEGRPYIGDGLITAGLLAAAVAAGAVIGDLVWSVVSAARNRSAGEDGLPGDTDREVRRAWEAWQLALLERGVVPFLLGRLEEASVGERGDHAAR